MNRLSIKIIFLMLPLCSVGQPITLDLCQQKARELYPLLKQYGLLEKTTEYSISNANKAWLPQLNLTGKISYQSEAIKIAIPAINLNMEQSKEQYNIALDVSQTLWDGGVVRAQKNTLKAQAEAEKQKLEVDLYALKERVNQLFFGILLLTEQQAQLKLLKTDLQSNFERMVALKQNGVVGQTDIDAIKVEQLNIVQKENDLQATRKSFVEMLVAFTGLTISNNSEFTKPIAATPTFELENRRPELVLLSSQKKHLKVSEI